MGTAGKMHRAQEAVQKAGTLAEAQSILDKLIAEEQEVSDIFFMQEEMVESLKNILSRQEQPVYIQPPAPIRKPSNILLYIGIGIGLLFLTGKVKL